MKQRELEGLLEVARLHTQGDEDAAMHSVVRTYKDDVATAGERVAAIAKVIAHARREHPGPFYGMDEGVLVALLATLSDESDKALGAVIVGIAIREAAEYNWRRSKGPHEYEHKGRPVFMTWEQAGCLVCKIEHEPEPEPTPDPEPEPEPKAGKYDVRVVMNVASGKLLKKSPEAERRFGLFMDYAATQLAADGETISGADLIDRYVGRVSGGVLNLADHVKAGLKKMEEEGAKGEVLGLTEPDAVLVIGNLLLQSKADLVAALFGIVVGLADMTHDPIPRRPTPGAARPAALVENMMKPGRKP